ncbi:hypothetical protein Kisp01_13260 [Kineosporia sp. NBRC 101677]|uniref:sacsin N-terminal ATP-binding-like domain-containing protein n=1 Tax=Kineosporia sp. NBRC 101677 TaxID=3032197 RepID=UPI0024A35FF7|nr:hypothetical protein [Kineosporia sp. NBRC 101677]GLY14310.1 hypothetical protein Kisp01_13260 [Kineosporia sp. NBRC 101677]
MTEDRFGAADIRRRVLAAWSESPTRFREDANAEEELVLGGYRDRLVVELAQNAADAASRAGVPGRLLLRLSESAEGGPVLVAANTGAVLDADGVQALCTLRASAKREGGTVGRFGVGFAAVLAVTDEPMVLSRSGGVRFSAADTRELIRATGVDGLADELQRRDGGVPVLRLPFEVEGEPPEGYDTAVLLPLNGPDAVARVRQLLNDVSDVLLLALPGLEQIVLELPGESPRVLAEVDRRWRILRREGEIPAELLSGRPIEEQALNRWSLTWALPSGEAELPQSPVLNAPTPSDEALPWPAVLIATVPMDVTRRHVVLGEVTDLIVQNAARAYADLLTEVVADGGEAWPLVVTGLPAGPVDSALREAVLALLPNQPVLRSAEDSQTLLRPTEALALAGPVGADRAVVNVFASWLVGLVHAPRPSWAALETLGVRRMWLSDAVEALPALADPQRWREAYEALAGLTIDETVREALAFLPVPLADGSVARGARGLLLASPETDVDAGAPISVPEALSVLGAKVVHPEAVHPLLERLGVTVAGPRALIELPVVRAAVREIGDEPGAFADLDRSPDELRDAVLALVAVAVAAGELKPGELPWLGDLELSDEDGEPTPASALAIEGSPAADWFHPDDVGILPQWWAERWGESTLMAIGVLRGPGAFLGTEVSLEPDLLGLDEEEGTPSSELDGWEDYAAWVQSLHPEMPPGGTIPEMIAVRDLDLVRPEALPEVVAAVAADPELRPALLQPIRVTSGGRSFQVRSYTSWWLREELAEGEMLAAPDSEPVLRALLAPAPDWLTDLDPGAARAVGMVHAVDDIDVDALPDLLDRLADPDVELSSVMLLPLLERISELAGEPAAKDVERPRVVRGLVPADLNGTVVVPVSEAVVIDSPMYRQRPDLGVQLPVAGAHAAAFADLLGVGLAAELAHGRIDSADGVEQPVGDAVRALLESTGAPATWYEHEALVVDGVEVDWWATGSGAEAEVHASTVDGLARALAWTAGHWELRDLLAAVIADPELGPEALVDQIFG